MATGNVPQHLRDYILSKLTHMQTTRKPPFFQLPTRNTSLLLNYPLYQAADTFNSLPAALQSAASLTSFKTVLRYSYSHANVHALSILVSR